MIETFTKKNRFPVISTLLILLLGLATPGNSQVLGCYTGTAPMLDAANAAIDICPGQKAVLPLLPFSSEESAVWYDTPDRTATLAILSNTDTPFSPTPGNSRSYWVALRNANDGCESELLQVVVTRLDSEACPVRNSNSNRSYKKLQDAHDDAASGDELLLSPGQYQAASVSKRLKFTGEAPLGQSRKAEIAIQSLTMNSNADLELNEGVFLINGTLNLIKGNLKMNTNSAVVIKGKIENGDDQSAIEMPIAGQSNADNFFANGKPIPPGSIRLESVNTLGSRFVPAYTKNAAGEDQYFALLLEAQSGNTAEIFDLALAGPASMAETQTYPGLTTEEEAGIQDLAAAANQRPGQVDQIFLLGPADGNDGALNLTISASANLGGPINPILWNWEPQGFDFTILTIDNDVALFRGVRLIQSQYNTFSTLESVTRFSPFAIVEGVVAEGPANTATAKVDRSFQQLDGSIEVNRPLPQSGAPCYGPIMVGPGDHHYSVIEFTPASTDIYTFHLAMKNFDGAAGAIYRGAFDPTRPCQSLMLIGTENKLADGMTYRNGAPTFRLLLEAGQTYQLLTIARNAEQSGSFSWQIFSENGGSLNASGISNQTAGVSGDLLEPDLPKILQNAPGIYTIDMDGKLVSADSPELERALLATGYATFTGCAGARIKVSDLHQNNSCGDDQIQRTFAVLSTEGCPSPINPVITQTISFRESTATDLIAPTGYTFVDMSLDLPVDEATGHVLPTISGRPFIETIFGFAEHTRALSTNWEDLRFQPTAKVDVYYRRDWRLFFSCDDPDPSVFEFQQFIRQAGQPFLNVTQGRYYSGIQKALDNALDEELIQIDTEEELGSVTLPANKKLTLTAPDHTTVRLQNISVGSGGQLLTQGNFRCLAKGNVVGAQPVKGVWKIENNGGLHIEGNLDLTGLNIAAGAQLSLSGKLEGGSPEAGLYLYDGRGTLRLPLTETNPTFVPLGLITENGEEKSTYTPLLFETDRTTEAGRKTAMIEIKIPRPDNMERRFPGSPTVRKAMEIPQSYLKHTVDFSGFDRDGAPVQDLVLNRLELFFPASQTTVPGPIMDYPVLVHQGIGAADHYLATAAAGKTLVNGQRVDFKEGIAILAKDVTVGSPITVVGCSGCGEGKSLICQITPENPDAATTQCIDQEQLPGALNNGSFCGPCQEEVRLAPIIPQTICSRSANPVDGNFSTGIMLSLVNEASYGNAMITYRLDAVDGAASLIPGAQNAAVNDVSDKNLIKSDTWINPTMMPVEVTYTITPAVTFAPGDPNAVVLEGDPAKITVFVLPKPALNIQMDIVGVDYPSSGTCGHFDVILDVAVCNIGPVSVKDLEAEVNLTGLTNGIFAGNARILGEAPALGAPMETLSLPNDLNETFDGASYMELFDPENTSVDKGDCRVLRLRFEVAPENAPSIVAASDALFTASAFARPDWAGQPANPDIDWSSACHSNTTKDEVALGSCWYDSRIAAANDNINVTTNVVCYGKLTPDMVLEGSRNACDTGPEYPLGGFYRVGVLYPGDREPRSFELAAEVNATDFPDQRVIVYVENVGNECEPLWGEINLEDKIAPRFECTPSVIDHVDRTYEVQTARGRLSERQRGQINFSDYSCYQDEFGAPGDCPEPYDIMEFYVSEADIYTFEAWDPERRPDRVENDNELHIALFQGSFNPQEPCANILVQSNAVSEFGVVENDDDPDGRFRLALPLTPGQKYTLLVAQDDCSRDRGDQWVVYAFSDGDGEILDDSKNLPNRFDDPRPLRVKKQLYCSDIAYILNRTEYTRNPLAIDNCDAEPDVWFEDVLTQNGDCGDLYITRTWQVRDAAGNAGENCTQRIEFKRPGLSDVQKPPTTVAIECDEITAAWLDENGYPKPEIAGYPFVITAFGIADLNEAFCNVGADYEDISDIEVCAGANKIVRQWTILDWCQIDGQWALNNGTASNWRQIIKVGDFSAPQVTTGGNLTVNAGPFSCAGVLIIPGIEVTDNCSDYTVAAVIYKVVEEAEVDRFGRPTGNIIQREEWFFEGATGDAVADIEVGVNYKLYYHVVDACGNAADPDPVSVTAIDGIEPVAVCKDDLTIGIGGEGIARITAGDVDEGSWDNCVLGNILISRQLENENLRDAWLAQIESLTFSDLTLADNDDPSGDGAEQWIHKTTGETILRRKNGIWHTAWRAEQYFICDDINAKSAIEMAVFDDAGNVNICWMEITVEDKVAPYCTAPPPITWNCTALPYGFDPADDDQLDALFGRPTSIDNCSADTAYQTRTQVDWNCNSGLIERWFEARDKNGLPSVNNCYQRITILPVHNYEIRFPADATAECGRPSPDTVLVSEIACDLLAISVIDERFAANEGDACYKIKRTYQVVNWCEYNGEDTPVVIGRNEDCDGEVGEEDVYVLRRPDITYIDRDNDENTGPAASPCGNGAKGHLTNGALEDRLTSNGYWQYTQYLKVYDRTAPTIDVTAPQPFCADNAFVRCSGDIDIPFSVTEECDIAGLSIEVWLDADADGRLDFEVTTAVLTGRYPNYRISGNYPIGRYAFDLRVSDGCNNGAVRRIPFEVVDCKAPTPICINGLAVELMPQEPGTDADGDGDEDAGAMSIWATDFKVSLDQDCSPGFTYSINRVGETPDIGRSGLILTCDDPDTVMVEIYIWDSADNPYALQPDGTVGGPNYDHCVSYVVVQDNMFDLCNNPSLTLAGLITTEEDKTVEDVEVRLSGPVTQMQRTRFDGIYAFNSLFNGADYTIQPWKDNAHLNGVSTFDLVLLTKHLLGIRKLESPYLQIAADVNRSQTISTLDLIHLRKLVLSVDHRFRNNSSWRFIPKNYVFPDPEDPWSTPFPELLSFNDLSASQLNADFIGIKIGDLNGNARPNSLATNEREIAGVFRLNAEDQDLIAGQEYRIGFTTEQLDGIQGYQFTLSLEGLELLNIEYGVARAAHFAVVDDAVITTSWNSTDFKLAPAAIYAEPGNTAELFALAVKANVNGRLSDLVHLNSRFTPAEAYGQSEELMDVQLSFGGEDRTAARYVPQLFQNEPNPFEGETVIRFSLPEAQTATIKIVDLNGRILRLIRGDYPGGNHQVMFHRADLPASGVLYYTLETEDFFATRKMVLIE